MATRRTFFNSLGLLSSLMVIRESFAQAGNMALLSQPVLSGRSKANSYWYIGHLMSVLLDSKQTGGSYSLLRASERRGLEPPPHTHAKEDETFIILEGEVIYTVGGQSFRAKAGDVMFLPKGVQHSFKIQSETLETLILLTPGGFENYFIEMSQPAQALQLPPLPQGPPDIPRLIATASKYGIKFSEP